MGACASKPKDLDLNKKPEPSPVPADTPTTPKKEDGVETKKEDVVEATKEEPLIDISEPATSDAPKVHAEAKVAPEELVVPVEASKATDEVKEEKKEVVETVEKPAAKVVAPQS